MTAPAIHVRTRHTRSPPAPVSTPVHSLPASRTGLLHILTHTGRKEVEIFSGGPPCSPRAPGQGGGLGSCRGKALQSQEREALGAPAPGNPWETRTGADPASPVDSMPSFPQSPCCEPPPPIPDRPFLTAAPRVLPSERVPARRVPCPSLLHTWEVSPRCSHSLLPASEPSSRICWAGPSSKSDSDQAAGTLSPRPSC